ncbi:hypothetical protein WA538_002488 [Blastocystis sp. DL]
MDTQLKNNKPLHMGTVISCIVVSIVWSLYNTMIGPNLPFIIRTYQDHIDEAMISTYNALLTTAYFLGTIIGSIMWGWIADRIGRKTALIITLCLNVVVLYLFGMCSHIKPAIILRVIHGIVDGIVPVSKTIQAEIANSENIAFVSSLFFVGGAIGGVIGPVTGGYLNKEEYICPFIRLFPIFKRLPYLFPIIVVCFLFLIALVIVIFCCKETLPKSDRIESHAKELSQLETSLLPSSAPKLPSVWSALAEKDTCLLVISYTFINLAFISFVTVYTVAITNSHAMGGFGLDSVGISTVTSAIAPTQLLIVFIIPYLGKLVLYKSIFASTCFLYGIACFLYPAVAQLYDAPTTVVYAVLTFYNACALFVAVLMMNATMILFANVAYHEMRGVVMGACETIAGLTRCIGPLLFSALYSWTCEQKPHRLVNPYLTFVLLGVTSLIAAILPIWVSPATNVSKGSYVEKVKLEAMSV